MAKTKQDESVQNEYSKEYVMGYITAMHHTKIMLQDMVMLVDKIEKEILGEDTTQKIKSEDESEEK